MIESLTNDLNKSKYPMTDMKEAMSIMLEKCVQAYRSNKIVVQLNLNQLEFKKSQGEQSLIGSILAEDVFAKDQLPPFRASVMDGYAFKVTMDDIDTF